MESTAFSIVAWTTKRAHTETGETELVAGSVAEFLARRSAKIDETWAD